MKNRKNSRMKKSGLVLLSAAVVLLAGSALGSTRAALIYSSEVYNARIGTEHIGVSLVENNDVVSYKNYEGSAVKDSGDGELLKKTFVNDKKESEGIKLGKTYPEVLKVRNTGTIDEYVRVRIYKTWNTKDEDGNLVKDTALSPSLIKLNISNDWKIGEETEESTVYYYPKPLKANEDTADLVTGITIDPEIATKVIQSKETKEVDGKKVTTTTTTYAYDGYTFDVRAEVDAVQTHSAKDAIRSAWGVDVEFGGDEETIVNVN